jgi:hypothetical protein
LEANFQTLIACLAEAAQRQKAGTPMAIVNVSTRET